MELDEAILVWKTHFGFITCYHQGQASQNDLLYTSEYFLLLVKRGADPKIIAPDFQKLMTLVTVQPGLFKRNPDTNVMEAIDDYVGIMAAYRALELTEQAKLVLDYGNKLTRCFWPISLKWVYNNISPGSFNASAWFGRQPQLIAHFMFACGIKPPLWRRLWWALVIANVGKINPYDEDSWILSYLMIQTARGQSKLATWAEKKWQKRFYKYYPSGMKACLGHYFQNEDHPIAKYWID